MANTPEGDRLFPGSPTQLRSWEEWLRAFEDDADAGDLERYEQDAALRKLSLTHKPELCEDIIWLEKHVTQIESGDMR